ncbi:MAG: hypothetical protein EXR72_05275, partial [Myxococcales bacterium]|nr:hypothetical protein [Myxococcales bacterium]
MTKYFYRADSASYEWSTIAWLRNEERPDGPKGFIGFGISADMSKELKAAVVAVPQTAWTPYKAPGEALDEKRDWAEVPFVPSEPSELSYIKTRKHKMRYASHYAANLPIGSGATESTCWQMQQRVKLPGQSWETHGLRGILAMR